MSVIWVATGALVTSVFASMWISAILRPDLNIPWWIGTGIYTLALIALSLTLLAFKKWWRT